MDDISTTDVLGLTGLTYDDVFLLPKLTDVVLSIVDTTSRLARKISLCVSLLLAATDTITEVHMAIAMARQGGIGTFHCNLSIEEQAQQVRLVKHSGSSMMEDPVTVGPEATIEQLDELCGHYRVSGPPVISEDDHLLGTITNRDLRFAPQNDWARLEVRDCMIPHERLAIGHVGVSCENAKIPLTEHCVEKLPIVGEDDCLTSLITVKDSVKTEQYPNATKDVRDRLIVGAAVGYWGDTWERATTLTEAGVDVLVVDIVNGRAKLALDMIRRIKNDPASDGIEIIGGNVAMTEGTQALIDAGVDTVKVGVGPGSICTTRTVAGVGVPQTTAIALAAKACGLVGVPLIADGGFRYSGDIGKALVAGADTAMLGSLLAGCEESLGEVVFTNGKQFKRYHGMGSLGAMSSRGRKSYSRDRYFRADVTSDDKIVPGGIEGQIPFAGSLVSVIYQLAGGLHQTTFYLDVSPIEETKRNGRFVRTISAGLREPHPYDVQMTPEAPNYHSTSGRRKVS